MSTYKGTPKSNKKRSKETRRVNNSNGKNDKMVKW